MLFPHTELRRQFTWKEKGKKKMLEYDTDREESDQSKFDSGNHEEGPSEKRSELVKKAIKLVEQKLLEILRID